MLIRDLKVGSKVKLKYRVFNTALDKFLMERDPIFVVEKVTNFSATMKCAGLKKIFYDTGTLTISLTKYNLENMSLIKRKVDLTVGDLV